jgi:hypothetical protein
VIGTGKDGMLPVLEAVKLEAKRTKIGLLILPTERAIDRLNCGRETTKAVAACQMLIL